MIYQEKYHVDPQKEQCEMKQGNSWFVQKAWNHINETYGFLFEKGYEILSAEDIPMGWQVVLRKQDLFVSILAIRGEEEVSFRISTQPSDEFIDIGSVVYAATGEKIPLSYSSYSKDLQKYLDRIETYFEGEYVNNQDSLRVAQKEYRETLPRVEVASPKEPEIIPILYYPLKGIIMLLLFGALTTLYAVLLDGLFSAFSLDPDSYRIFMGVVSLLLAIGTMLSIRRKMG